ncbi:unnamed protein product [Leuciscus chuanchicus]
MSYTVHYLDDADAVPWDYSQDTCEASEARGSRGMKMSLKVGGEASALELLNHVPQLVLWQKLPLKKPPELLNRRIRIACFITYNKQTVGLHCESAVKVNVMFVMDSAVRLPPRSSALVKMTDRKLQAEPKLRLIFYKSNRAFLADENQTGPRSPKGPIAVIRHLVCRIVEKLKADYILRGEEEGRGPPWSAS